MSKVRILSGGITQESHSFNPIPTTRRRFVIQSGAEAVSVNRGANSTLGGVIDSADLIGAEVLVPTLYRAQSGGCVEDSVFDEVCEIMTSTARRGDFDAIVLPLHGGMATPKHVDPEGHLAGLLRQIVGADVPITAAFDLHAYVTPETLAPLDFLAGYLTNPHGDQAATARRAFRAAIDMLEGRLDPVCAAVFFPMLTLGNDRTDEEPLQGLHAHARALIEDGRAYDVSIFNAQQFLDLPNVGQAVLVYTNGDEPDARAMSDDVAERLWADRDALVGHYPTLEDSLSRLGTSERRLILGDQGDRVAGGGPGDSTFILNHLLGTDFAGRAIVPVYDPAAVEAATRAGAGAKVRLSIGGRYCTVAAPVDVEVEVVTTGAGAVVTYEGPADKGSRVGLAGYAVVRVRGIAIMLTAEPYSYLDPAYFRAVGLDPLDYDVTVVRSGYHFTLNFASIGRCITVGTPGMTSYDVDRLPWRFARPFYPLDTIPYRPTRTVRRRAGIGR